MASVFVRNLPYGVTQEELEQLFGDVGPVKKVDVIKDKGKRKSDMLSRGFAFVRFAIESDAQYAVEKLHNHEFQGRRMRLEIAREKGAKNKQQQQQQQAPAPAKTAGAEDFIPLEAAAAPTEEKKHKKEKKAAAEEPVAPVVEQQEQEQEEEAPKKAKKEKEKKKHKKEQQSEAREEAPAVASEQHKAPKQQQQKPAKEVAAKSQKQQPATVGDGPNFAAAEPKIGPDGHVQSERNARRRMHREFLRQVEQRKNDAARPEDKTIVMYGLGADVTQKHIAKKVKKIGKATKVELKAEEKTGKKFAVVEFEKLADALSAVTKLDHHIFKGAMLKVKRMSESGAKENEGLRLIVRNLHFDTTDGDLEKAFAAHGPLFEARVVRMPVEDAANAAPDALGRSRGFGFVQFRDVADARAAVEALNGVKVRGREMIVDFALAKSKYVEQQKTMKSMEVNPDDDEDDGEDGGEGHDNELEMASGDEATDDEEEDDDDEGESDDDEEDEGSAEPKADTDAQRYRTIFIRNLSFQTTEEGLKAFFATFGAVEYARVVFDHGSGLSKGVGFVRFKDPAIADSVLARGQFAAEREERKKGKKGKKENQFTLSALADGDALVLDGRMLSLTRAVAKADAERLATENSNERKKKDKRNMYLAYEGTINVNKLSDEELNLPKLDIEKRRRAIREKKEKLKNPMYFVSPLRLSVRNLGAAVDDKKLKEVFRDGALAGMREKNVDRAEVKPELLLKSDAAPVKVKMAKVVRDTETAKATGKEARSRGYGFVEFAEHVHALAALRKLNNNPAFAHLAAGAKTDKKGAALGESERSRLIVEFALENHGKLKLREKRQQDAEKRREEERALREAQGLDGAKGEKKSRGQRQREAKKARALTKSEEQEADGGETKKSKKKTKEEVVVSSKKPSGKRKRDDVESVAATLPAGSVSSAAKTKKAKKQKAAPSRKERKQAAELAAEESFDALVRNYKREIFGEKPLAKGEDAAEARERWFD